MMWKRRSAVIFLGLFVATVSAQEPRDDVNVTAYLGRWYQVYASVFIKYSFELGGNCVTADYGATDEDGVVSVLNTVRPLARARRFLPNRLDGIKVRGFAAQDPASATSGALSVNLGHRATADGTTFSDPGNYWIIDLGPIVDDLYDWAVVSDSDQRALYVLTRDVARFREEYEETVLADLEAMGFTDFGNKPRPTNQDNCYYENED
jgi:lipocalin